MSSDKETKLKQDKRAEALRANLKKRKAQAKTRENDNKTTEKRAK